MADITRELAPRAPSRLRQWFEETGLIHDPRRATPAGASLSTRIDFWCWRNAERVQASVCAFGIAMIVLAAYSELIHPAFTGKRWLMTIVCQGEPLSERCPAIYHEGKPL